MFLHEIPSIIIIPGNALGIHHLHYQYNRIYNHIYRRVQIHGIRGGIVLSKFTINNTISIHFCTNIVASSQKYLRDTKKNIT